MSDSATEYDKLFIGGKWTKPSTSDVIEVRCPATGEYVGKVPMAAAADVDAAVAAARAAFDNGPWPSTPPHERAAVIAAAVKMLAERKDLFTKLLAAETGQPPTIIETMHWMGSMGAMNYFAGAADKVTWTETRTGSYGQSIVSREPVGVVGAIVAWNVPLFLAVNKIAPALLAGCTIVLKPAAETPLTANALAEVFAEVGLPEGVLSVVPGGIETGQALTSNPDIDMFTFTGSSAVGREVGRRAAEMLKPCTLELGGKSAAIILEDVDLAAAIPMMVFSGVMNAGQGCVNQTRILAPRSRYDEIVAAVTNFVTALPVGPPSDPAAQSVLRQLHVLVRCHRHRQWFELPDDLEDLPGQRRSRRRGSGNDGEHAPTGRRSAGHHLLDRRVRRVCGAAGLRLVEGALRQYRTRPALLRGVLPCPARRHLVLLPA